MIKCLTINNLINKYVKNDCELMNVQHTLLEMLEKFNQLH